MIDLDLSLQAATLATSPQRRATPFPPNFRAPPHAPQPPPLSPTQSLRLGRGGGEPPACSRALGQQIPPDRLQPLRHEVVAGSGSHRSMQTHRLRHDQAASDEGFSHGTRQVHAAAATRGARPAPCHGPRAVQLARVQTSSPPTQNLPSMSTKFPVKPHARRPAPAAQKNCHKRQIRRMQTTTEKIAASLACGGPGPTSGKNPSGPATATRRTRPLASPDCIESSNAGASGLNRYQA